MDNDKFGPLEKELEILNAYDKCVSRAKHKKLFQNNVDDEDDTGVGAGVDAPSAALPAPTKKVDKDGMKIL